MEIEDISGSICFRCVEEKGFGVTGLIEGNKKEIYEIRLM